MFKNTFEFLFTVFKVYRPNKVYVQIVCKKYKTYEHSLYALYQMIKSGRT